MNDTDLLKYARKYLHDHFPTAFIVQIEEGEVIALLENWSGPTSGSRVIAFFGTTGSKAHFHRVTTESYELLEGILAIEHGGEGCILDKRRPKQGDSQRDPGAQIFSEYPQGHTIFIGVGQIHRAWAVGGNFAVAQVEAHPAWKDTDHFITPKGS